jgi:hypothetical protein
LGDVLDSDQSLRPYATPHRHDGRCPCNCSSARLITDIDRLTAALALTENFDGDRFDRIRRTHSV